MSLKDKAKIFGTSCRALGIWETSRAILADLFTYKPRKDLTFDRRYGTDTASVVFKEDLNISNAEAKKGAIFYVSAPIRLEQYILDKLDIDYREYDFFDIGCGKGRVLMIASDFAFRSISGVEISRNLCEIARKNLKHYRSPNQRSSMFEIHCMDARDFPIRSGNTVFHFYHPFDREILSTVLGNIRSAFQNSDGRALIVYIWTAWGLPTLFPLFEKFGFKRVRYEQTASWRYHFAIYTFDRKLLLEGAGDSRKAD
jgi:SAM-dependent methyltransferase